MVPDPLTSASELSDSRATKHIGREAPERRECSEAIGRQA